MFATHGQYTVALLVAVRRRQTRPMRWRLPVLRILQSAFASQSASAGVHFTRSAMGTGWKCRWYRLQDAAQVLAQCAATGFSLWCRPLALLSRSRSSTRRTIGSCGRAPGRVAAMERGVIRPARPSRRGSADLPANGGRKEGPQAAPGSRINARAGDNPGSRRAAVAAEVGQVRLAFRDVSEPNKLAHGDREPGAG